MLTRTAPVTRSEMQLALKTMFAVVDSIRELGRVPSGHLYAGLMSVMDFESYNAMLRQIIATGLVRQENHELIWVG